MNQEIIASNDTRIKSISYKKNRAGRVSVAGGETVPIRGLINLYLSEFSLIFLKLLKK